MSGPYFRCNSCDGRIEAMDVYCRACGVRLDWDWAEVEQDESGKHTTTWVIVHHYKEDRGSIPERDKQ